MKLTATDILIVDDNTPMRTLLKSYLTAFGAKRLREAASAQQAIMELKLRPADLLLLDHSMPGMSGLDFARSLRQSEEPEIAHMRIVMISGHGDSQLVAEARDSGVDEFLVKPVTMANLMERIEKVMTGGRSFIRADGFFGPDRRRRRNGRLPKGGERRATEVELD